MIRALLVGLAGLAVTACGTFGESAAFKSMAGRAKIGVANVVLRDDEQGKDLPLRVAYPQESGKFPIVVLSHGGGASKDDYTRAGDHWVSHGYIVIAPTHKDSKSLGFDIAKAGGPAMGQVMLSRIADMALIARRLDVILAQVPGLAPKADRAKLVAAGHSMGGFTALAAAGVRLKNKADSSTLDMADTGYKYLLLLSEPGSNPMMPDEPWRQSPIPTFVYTGTNDRGSETTGRKSPFGYAVIENAAAASQPRHYLWVEGVDHYLGGLWCRTDVPGPLDHDGLNIFNGVSTAFLDAYAKDDARALAFLTTANLKALTSNRATLTLK
jgi:pimeloyl-ACP methyl ester carboxylesterase